jgi:hypothetical protein
MTNRRRQVVGLTGMAVLLLARHDLWWWHDPGLVVGLPVGLVWHVGICLAAVPLLDLLARSFGAGDAGP